MTDRWPQVEQLRPAILKAEAEAARLRDLRDAIIMQMVRAGVTRREIGELWGVSNVAITHVVNRLGGTERIMKEDQ